MYQQFVADNKTMSDLFACAPFGRLNVIVDGRPNWRRCSSRAAITTGCSAVLGESMALVVLGILIGVAIALSASHLISTLLFGLPPRDPLSMMPAVLVMVVVSALAGYLPARRASKVDPMVALHDE